MEYYDEDKVWQRLFSTEHRAKYIDYIRRVRSRGRVGSLLVGRLTHKKGDH